MDLYTKTLNKTGFALNAVLDPVVKQFVEFSRCASLPVLELGCAYGMSSLECLGGDTTLILNDLDERHLRSALDGCPEEKRKQLVLLPGDMEALPILDGSLAAILCCRVIHFFEPDKLLRALARVYGWLAPGGKAFVTVESPYLGIWPTLGEDFLCARRQGRLFPGYIRVRDYVADDDIAANLPDHMNLFDVETLSQVFKDTGFHVESCQFVARPYFFEQLQLDGRESVGIVAVKG